MVRNILGLLLFAALTSVPNIAVAQIRVVASFSILGDIAEQIGGTAVHVTPIVGPDQDAHIYSPSVADARAFAAADLVILNGLGFETWADRLIAGSGTRAPILTVANDLAVVLHNEDEDAETAHASDDVDPHAWGAIANGIVYAAAIREAFTALEPAESELFQANFAAFERAALNAKASYQARISALPVDHRTIVTSHDAFGYFAEESGLTFLAPLGLNSAAAATASQVRDLITQLKALPHAALFVENIHNPALIQQIADETGLQVSNITLYSDALSGPEGPASTYLDWYSHNMESVLAALEENH